MYNMKEYAWSNNDITVLGVTIAHEELVEKNYHEMPEKVKNIMNAWYNRGLSLLGKVQVVNTLIASLFVYKMMVLPSIPKYMVKKIDNLIRDFLWNGKKSKVAYNILQVKKEDGGLNLVNLTIKDKALKATWPQILSQEKDYSQVVYKTMKCSAIGVDIWKCSIEPSDVQSMKILNTFWSDVLTAWSEFNYYYNRRIENQIIWYNSNIKINGKMIMWRDIHLHGLEYVYQLFEQGRFISFEKAKYQFGLTRLRYNSLKVAIPKEWKSFFTQTPYQQFSPIPPHNYDTCVNVYQGKFSRIVYRYLQDDVMVIHNKYIKWLMEVGTDFTEGILEFGKLHKDIYKITNIAKYRSFQYRLLQRALVTNIQMYKWGMIDSDLCTFCHAERESLSHLMYQCTIVQQLWTELLDFVQDKYLVNNMQVSVKSIIQNTIMPTRGHIINFICLITKQFIYRQRCMGGALHFPILREIIRSTENIEKYIAIKNDRLYIHNRKWRIDMNQCEQNDYVLEYVNEM